METKHPVRYAGEVERQVVDLADRFGWVRPGSPVRVMSFSVAAVARVRRFAPDLTTVLLVDAVPRWARFAPAGYLPAGVPVLGRRASTCWRRRRGWVQQVREAGHALHVWTVDTPEGVDACLEAGAVAVITNRPQDVLGRTGRGPHGAWSTA